MRMFNFSSSSTLWCSKYLFCSLVLAPALLSLGCSPDFTRTRGTGVKDFTLRVSVVDSETGKAIQGARVSLRHPENPSGRLLLSGETNDKGFLEAAFPFSFHSGDLVRNRGGEETVEEAKVHFAKVWFRVEKENYEVYQEEIGGYLSEEAQSSSTIAWKTPVRLKPNHP